jgi:ankyrin repeat protein
VEVLWKVGADATVKDDLYGKTPLHLAAESGSASAVVVLLKAGADAKAKDGDGKTPLHWAAERFRLCVGSHVEDGC